MRRADSRKRAPRVNDAKRLRELIKNTFPADYGDLQIRKLSLLLACSEMEDDERKELADFLLELRVKMEQLIYAIEPPNERDIRDGAIALSYLIHRELKATAKSAKYKTAKAWEVKEDIVAKAITRCRAWAKDRLAEYSTFWAGKLDKKAYNDGLRNVLKNIVQ